MASTGAGWECTTVSGSIPAGLIAFTAGACPSGWTEYTAARGFAIVGLPASGTAAGTVGTAFTDLQNKSVTPSFSGSALATHAHGAGTLVPNAHAGTAVADHTSHTHTYTTVIAHTHTQASTTTSTGSTSNRLGTVDTTSTAEATGSTGSASGTTAGPDATLTHNVTQPNTHTMSGTSEAVTGGTPAGTVTAVTTSGLLSYIQFRVCSKD